MISVQRFFRKIQHIVKGKYIKKKGEKMEDRQKKVQKVIAERKRKVEKQKKNITGMVMISIIRFCNHIHIIVPKEKCR